MTVLLIVSWTTHGNHRVIEKRATDISPERLAVVIASLGSREYRITDVKVERA
jgi:hypothetical protein